jgi:hypothetical protein
MSGVIRGNYDYWNNREIKYEEVTVRRRVREKKPRHTVEQSLKLYQYNLAIDNLNKIIVSTTDLNLIKTFVQKKEKLLKNKSIFISNDQTLRKKDKLLLVEKMLENNEDLFVLEQTIED